MPDEKYKPVAKCRYYELCSLYNNDVLKPDIEIKMCGLGRPVNNEYIPEIPESADFKPSRNYAHGTGGECEAYTRYKNSQIISTLVDHLISLQALVDKHGYW